MRSRAPKQLLLAFFGEQLLGREARPIRAGVLLEVLENAGVAPPTTRATLDRMAANGFLVRHRSGREIRFELTDDARTILEEGGHRVHGPHPFDAHGPGWTLVTFSLSEGHRTVRHRLRAALTWAGFAPLRDGLWLSPGEVDLGSTLEPLHRDLPRGAVSAFRAIELEGFSMAESVREAWDIDRIRAEHGDFIARWGDPGSRDGATSALAARTMLVADWLALLRIDPRLPRDFMGDDWPADRSVEVYRARQRELSEPSAAEFAALVDGDRVSAG